MAFDVSDNNGTIDWEAARAAGHDVVFIKLSEGATFTDPFGEANWYGAGRAGFRRAPYHFHRAGKGCDAQANHFLAILHELGGLEDTDLPPVLDFEDRDGIARIGSDVAVTEACGILELMRTGRKRSPMIYIDRDLANPETTPTVHRFGVYHLWLACYAVQIELPSAWSDWAWWQYSETGTVPGVGSGTVDLDRFRFDADQLEEWVKGTILV